MAGIRGAKNPVPTKPASGPTGVFKQSGSAGPFVDRDVLTAARGGERKGPPASRNSGTTAGPSHKVNDGLKRGTSDR
jgi:hypothetical protein